MYYIMSNPGEKRKSASLIIPSKSVIKSLWLYSDHVHVYTYVYNSEYYYCHY